MQTITRKSGPFPVVSSRYYIDADFGLWGLSDEGCDSSRVEAKAGGFRDLRWLSNATNQRFSE
jgi:hypothetical protein